MGARFSALVQIRPETPLASCTMCTGTFPGVKRPERGLNHPPPSCAEVTETAQVYSDLHPALLYLTKSQRGVHFSGTKMFNVLQTNVLQTMY